MEKNNFITLYNARKWRLVQKLFGIIIDSTLRFQQPVSEMYNKTRKRNFKIYETK